MRKIFALITLFLSLSISAQETTDTMYIYRGNNVVERIAVTDIDSITFTAPAVVEEEIPVIPNLTPGEAVDLGLPSGIKWASCNVGASSPEEYGGYYAWGEIEEKEDYSWATYKWCNGSSSTMTKYCTSSSYGTVDNKTVLDLEDDVAHVEWGGSWRMPTNAEQRELIKNCTWSWIALNGVDGYKVTGPNGNSIFMPVAGFRYDMEVYNRGLIGFYWSSSLYGDICNAYYLYFCSRYRDWILNYDRFRGLTVRPVCD